MNELNVINDCDCAECDGNCCGGGCCG